MGIASLVAWFMMAAVQCNEPFKGQQDCCLPGPDGPCWSHVVGRVELPLLARSQQDAGATPDAAPTAEHVIEIRTKREDHGMAIEPRSIGLGEEWHCADPNDELEHANQCSGNTCTSMYSTPHCIRVTREIWIDGVKFGVLRETGDK